jgi:hypothetical protein
MIFMGVLGYSMFAGLTWCLLYECTDWESYFRITAGFFWPFFFPGILGIYFSKFIIDYLNKVKEYKKIPQIYIKEGAKINTSIEYENLKQLVTDFETKYRIPMWQEFENKVIEIVDRQEEDKVPSKAYAQTYARHIIASVRGSIALNVSAIDGVRIQMFYILNNMEGTSEEDLRAIQKLSHDKGIDISKIVDDMLSGEKND